MHLAGKRPNREQVFGRGLLQLLTSNAASTDPRPVAMLYVAPVAGYPATPGTLLSPEGVEWNGLPTELANEYKRGLALPCGTPCWPSTTSAMMPAKDGAEAEVPEPIQNEPFSATK